jgi:hypothetical protein
MLQLLCSYRRDRARGGLERALLTGSGVLALAACVGCGVDERTLRAATSNNASGGSAGSVSTLPEGGNDGGNQPVLPRCNYFGTEVEPGCETLVKNAGFTSNVASWVAEPVGMTEGWQDSDANDNHGSGSLVVMNLNYKIDEEAIGGSNGGAARQCIPVSPSTTYDLAADIFIPAGQGMGFEGDYTSVATLSVFYYEGADCAGRSLTNFNSPGVSKTDEWVHVEGSTVAPKESRSMAVRLATLKPFRQIMFAAYFDNVFVQERSAP